MIKQLFDLNMKMASISRYSQTHLIMNESVLEHTGCVCLFAYYLSLKLKPVNRELNLGELFSKATVHDIDEVITGDIPHPTKYANEKVTNEIRAIEESGMQYICDTVFMNNKPYKDWSNSKIETCEGVIIMLSDCIAVLYKIWQETILYRNKTIKDHVNNVQKTLLKLDQYQHFFKDDSFNTIIEESLDICEEIKNES